VYLSCSSRPILENSRNIQFARYPDTIAKNVGFENLEEEWFVKRQVEDFNWLRKERSPNWSILREGIDDDTWRTTLNLMDEEHPESESLLKLVLK